MEVQPLRSHQGTEHLAQNEEALRFCWRARKEFESASRAAAAAAAAAAGLCLRRFPCNVKKSWVRPRRSWQKADRMRKVQAEAPKTEADGTDPTVAAFNHVG